MLIRRFLIVAGLILSFTATAKFVQAQAVTASKVVIIDTSAFFDEKSGIIKIITASKTLSTELAGKRTEVQALAARIDSLSKEIEVFRSNAAKGIPIDEKVVKTKIDDAERLKREGKYKEDEFNALAKKRQAETVGPIYSEVLRALSEYVKTKDYGLIFDASKDQNGMLLFASEKFDITKEFIAFYNARPVTAIAPVPR